LYSILADVVGVIKKVAEACTAGASTISLCKLGDEAIVQETSKLYTKKVNGSVLKKGAIPIWLS
jgi:hypothetical protein